MFTRRLAAAVVAVVFSFGLALAQKAADPAALDRIENWTAPPYWMPLKEVAIEKAGREPGLEPQAAAGVPTPALAFTGIAPCRIADTRSDSGFTGQYGPPQITPAGRTITIAGQCGIPGGAEAVSFNFHAVNVAAAGFFVAYPAGGAFPPVAIMAYNQNTPNISNSSVVPLGTGGAITVVAGVTNIDLIIDTNGYYAPQTVVNTVNGLSGAVTLAAGSNVTITPSGQTLTIASTGGGAAGWSLTGNSGTTPGTNFLGTTDNQALEIKVFNQRVFRFEPTAGDPNVIGGSSVNFATAGVTGATIGGGGGASENRVTDSFGTVAGGSGNRAGDNAGNVNDRTGATVGGGQSNTASGQNATVGGGTTNNASNDTSTVGGGTNNTASGPSSSVGGGNSNIASGLGAAVPGGFSNAAVGSHSFAGGRQAKANHQGAFVWGGSVAADVASTAVNQFIVRAEGGIWLGTTSAPSLAIATDFLNTSTGAHLTIGGAWTDNSDRDSKENFQEIDEREILSRVATLPISRWSYKAEGCDVEHLGPMAQDFSAAFGLGSDDRSISTLDSSGVALAAIQALYEEVQELRKRLAALEGAKD